MRLCLSILGIVAALILCGVSMAMNFLFLSSLGKSALEGNVLGAASSAGDTLKALLPFFIAWAWRDARLVAVLSGLLVWVFLAGFSFLSAIGFAAESRGTVTLERTHAAARNDQMQAELHGLEARLKALPPHRPVEVVNAAIAGHKQNRRWTSTKGCMDATQRASRAFCTEYYALQEERAFALEAESLRAQGLDLRRSTKELQTSGANKQIDAQVSLLAQMVNFKEEHIRTALIIAVALLVELGSSLGLFLATRHGMQKDIADNAAGNKSHGNATSKAEVQPLGCVEEFCLNALVRGQNKCVSMTALVNAYENWCQRQGFRPLTSDEFSKRLTMVLKEVGLPVANGHVGSIALADTLVKRLQAANTQTFWLPRKPGSG